MMSFPSKPWIAPLAAGSATILSALLGLPAQAAGPCNSGLLIETIYNSGMTGYSCQFGDLTYNFSSDIVELKDGKPGGPAPMVNFEASGPYQTLSFVNLYRADDVVFSYTVTSSKVSILPYSPTVNTVLQNYTQDPDTYPPSQNIVFSNMILPVPPNAIVRFEPNFSPYTDPNDPFFNKATLTSLTNTIKMTPGPLPVVGAGLTFAMSRKLRQRIKQAA